MKIKTYLLVVITVYSVCFMINSASACTIGKICTHELKLQGILPVEAKGIVWSLGKEPDDTQQLTDYVTLRVFNDNFQWKNLEINILSLGDGDVIIIPQDGFQRQFTHDITVVFPEELFGEECRGVFGTHTQTFHIGSIGSQMPRLAAREPTKEPFLFETAIGSCHVEENAARTDISIQWPQTFESMKETLEVEVLLNGKVSPIPIRGSTFTMAATCEEPSNALDALPEGDYEVIARSSLPQTNVKWDSEPLMISLNCDDRRTGCACTMLPTQPTTPPFVILVLGLMLFRSRVPSDRTTR